MAILSFSKENNSLGLTMRQAQPGPEAELVDLFVSQFYEKKEKVQKKYAVFFEPLLPTGFPDIVIAEYNEQAFSNWNDARRKLEIIDLKLLHHLYYAGGASSDQIFQQLGFSQGDLLYSLERLLDANLIRRNSQKWVPISLRKAYGIKSLHAIEAKIGKWDSVLNQAFLNKWFASESSVLMPVVTPSKQNQVRAAKQGVGIYTVAGNHKKILQFAPAEKGNIPTCYASWFFNEWIGRKLVSGR